MIRLLVLSSDNAVEQTEITTYYYCFVIHNGLQYTLSTLNTLYMRFIVRFIVFVQKWGLKR